jgi:hypothetical protein
LFVSFFHGAKYKDGDGDGKIKRQFRAGKHLSDALTACRIDQPKPIGKVNGNKNLEFEQECIFNR